MMTRTDDRNHGTKTKASEIGQHRETICHSVWWSGLTRFCRHSYGLRGGVHAEQYPASGDLSMTAQVYGAWKMTEQGNSSYARHLLHDALQVVVRQLTLR